MKIIKDICPKLNESIEINMEQCTNKNFIIKISTFMDKGLKSIMITTQLFKHEYVCDKDNKGYNVYLFGSSYAIPFHRHNVFNKETGAYMVIPLIIYRHVDDSSRPNIAYNIAVWLKYDANFSMEIPISNGDDGYKMVQRIHTDAGMNGKIVIATGNDAKSEMDMIAKLYKTINDDY